MTHRRRGAHFYPERKNPLSKVNTLEKVNNLVNKLSLSHPHM